MQHNSSIITFFKFLLGTISFVYCYTPIIDIFIAKKVTKHEIIFTFFEDYFIVKSKCFVSKNIFYKEVYKYVETENSFFLYLDEKTAYAINKNVIDKKIWEQLSSLLKGKIIENKEL